MPDKLTDAEIKQALECCCNSQGCSKCDFSKKCDGFTSVKLALKLINRLQAENSNLQEKNSNLTSDLSSLQNDFSSLKAENERLKKSVEILKKEIGKREPRYDPSEEIDNLLKEFVSL